MISVSNIRFYDWMVYNFMLSVGFYIPIITHWLRRQPSSNNLSITMNLLPTAFTALLIMKIFTSIAWPLAMNWEIKYNGINIRQRRYQFSYWMEMWPNKIGSKTELKLLEVSGRENRWHKHEIIQCWRYLRYIRLLELIKTISWKGYAVLQYPFQLLIKQSWKNNIPLIFLKLGQTRLMNLKLS